MLIISGAIICHVTVYETYIHFTGAHLCWQMFQHHLLGNTVSYSWKDTNTQKYVLKHPHVYVAACIKTRVLSPASSYNDTNRPTTKHGEPQFITCKYLYLYLFHLWRSQHKKLCSVSQLLAGSRDNLMGGRTG